MSSLKETALLCKRVFGGKLKPYAGGSSQYGGTGPYRMKASNLETTVFIGHFLLPPDSGSVLTGILSLGGVGGSTALPAAQANYGTISVVIDPQCATKFGFVGYALDRSEI